jgi:FecR protein
MFRIIIGRVRVKVARFGGKPNPYRINSPTASILVRGTEFGVAVESSGDTRVEVYEGLVEVHSLSDPRYRALLSAGRGAMVRPNEDIRFFTPGSGNRINERGDRNNGDDGSRRDDDEVEVEIEDDDRKSSSRGDDDDDGPQRDDDDDDDGPRRNDVAANAGMSLRAFLANDYERFINNIAGLGWTIPLQRGAAFADSHFDSLDNPAYSTEFTSIEGRFWLIPSFNRARGADLRSGSAVFPFSGDNPISPFDSGLLLQGDFFIPLERARAVIGGAVAVSGDRSQSLTVDRAPSSLISFTPEGGRVSRLVAVSTETTSITGSLMAARRFGDEGRTSVGAAVEWVSGNGDLQGQLSLANDAGSLANEELKAASQINRLRFRLGMTRELNGAHKLGLIYSHGLTIVDDRDRSRLFNGLPLSLDSTRQEGQSSEVSFRLRGPFTRRLFYGLEGSMLWSESDERIRRAVITDSTARARAGRAVVGLGVGFALRRTTVLSGDFAFGLLRVREERREDATGNPVEDRRERERFTSGRLGLQTDVWRRSFVSVSALAIERANTTDLNLLPDLFGRRLTSLGLAESDGRSRQNITSVFSDFGAGWRFTPNLLAEYILSVNRDLGPPRHVFLLRYTFKRED